MPFSELITIIFILLLLLVIISHTDKTYTFYNYSLVILILIYSLITQNEQLRIFYITFLIILAPFFIVNGILTGTYIENPVVWYNNEENLGIRLFTIPIEDSVYAFTLILTNLALTEYFKKTLFSK